MKKEKTYDFQRYETIRSLGDGIYTRKANIVEPEEDHSNLFKSTVI